MLEEMKQTTLANKVPHGSRISGIVMFGEERVMITQFRRIVFPSKKSLILNKNNATERAPRMSAAGARGDIKYL